MYMYFIILFYLFLYFYYFFIYILFVFLIFRMHHPYDTDQLLVFTNTYLQHNRSITADCLNGKVYCLFTWFDLLCLFVNGSIESLDFCNLQFKRGRKKI